MVTLTLQICDVNQYFICILHFIIKYAFITHCRRGYCEQNAFSKILQLKTNFLNFQLKVK